MQLEVSGKREEGNEMVEITIKYLKGGGFNGDV